jgi:hypothetical protein
LALSEDIYDPSEVVCLAPATAPAAAVNPGVEIRANPRSHPWADVLADVKRHGNDMNINVYVINAILILMVVRQIREHPLDLRSLALPVLAVGVAAVLFLHSVPLGGSDAVLELACVLAGATMGAVGGLATHLRRGPDGRPMGRAGVLAASMWVGGVGARLAFAVAASNGAGPAIARFSMASHITGSAAWIAALIMMAMADVLTRLVLIYLRGRRLTASAPALIAAGISA